MANSIMIIMPYWHAGTWVFDDDRVGLIQEPFVAGADEVISRLVEHLGIPNAKDGFKMTFSAGAFPGHHVKATWLREETPSVPESGNWYRIEIEEELMEGWLCPALFKYFDVAPKELFLKLEPQTE